MHNPELLILDEPTSGLDPLAQQTLPGHGRRGRRPPGRRCSCPAHIMSEVEAVADRVGIIREGRLVALDTVAGLRADAVRDVEVTFAGPVDPAEFTALAGVADVQIEGATLRCQVTGSPDALLRPRRAPRRRRCWSPSPRSKTCSTATTPEKPMLPDIYTRTLVDNRRASGSPGRSARQRSD